MIGMSLLMSLCLRTSSRRVNEFPVRFIVLLQLLPFPFLLPLVISFLSCFVQRASELGWKHLPYWYLDRIEPVTQDECQL